MLVSEILAIKGKVLFTIAPNRSIAEAVEIMNEQDVGSLVVFSRGAPPWRSQPRFPRRSSRRSPR